MKKSSIFLLASYFDSLYKINDQTPSRSNKEQFISPKKRTKKEKKDEHRFRVNENRQNQKNNNNKKCPEFYLKRKRKRERKRIKYLHSHILAVQLKAFYAPPETPLSVIFVCTYRYS